MPFTLNGIGTHYYGAGNKSARIDICQQCHRSTTLSSYDTRECICVLFIPIIPLKKYRIVDDCASCRKHYRVPHDQFLQQVEGQIAPLRVAASQAPRDARARAALIEGLINLELRADAQKEIDEALPIFQNDAALHVLAGQLATDRSDWKGALPLFERAQSLDPANGAAVYGYGWLLHQLGRDEEALPVLQRAVSQSYNSNGALYLLGLSQMRLSRWQEALQSFQQLLSLNPHYVDDKRFMRLLGDCKRRLGFELTDAERKAGRRWWPFGGATKVRRPQALQAAGPNAVRPSLRIAGFVILGIMLLSLGVMAWEDYTSSIVFFDNGTSRLVEVELDGARKELVAGNFFRQELSNGKHTVIVREPGGAEMERLTFELEPMSLWDSLVHDRLYVYNIASMNVYRRAKHGYAVDVANATYEEQILPPERFFEQRDVDFKFEHAPETLEMKGSYETKVSLNPAKDIPLARYAMMRLAEGKPDEARTMMARAVKSAPCEVPTRRMQLYLASILETEDAAASAARQWIGDCADDNLEAHRAYQDLHRTRGRQDALREEYQKMLASSPESAQAHYLVGRITADPGAALAEHDAAIRLDPKLVWPHVARGSVLVQEERFDEALVELATALDMPGRDPSIASYYASAAIARGTPEAAVAKLDSLLQAEKGNGDILAARWTLALAARDWKRASELQKSLAEFEDPRDAWWRRMMVLRFQGDEKRLDEEVEAAARDKSLRDIVSRARIEIALGRGDYAAAATAIDGGAKDLDPLSVVVEQAYAAGGFLIRGDSASASRLLDAATKILQANQDAAGFRVVSTLVAGVRGSLTPDAVMTIMRENDLMEHGWFVAAVRSAVAQDRARAAEHLAKALRASSDLAFPHLEVKRMASLL